MPQQPPGPGRERPPSIEHEELRGISRTVAEIEWLLLILVLLYLTFGGPAKDDEIAITAALLFYAAFVMSFRYANFYKRETRWKIAIETWAMIVFITWSLWFTGKLASPLLNTYMLAVITSALTLGKLTTLIEVVLIAACHVLLADADPSQALFTLRGIGSMAAQLAPVLLVAYVTTMFSADIRYGLNKAKLLSETDELTGLYNTRGFAIVADRLFGQAQRYKRAVSVLMVDSDNLKSVNDTHGHEAGNRLLKQLAARIQAELRYTDVPARYGGDEFILLLPETPSRGAADVAERIRESMAAKPIVYDGKAVPSTVSIGVATFPEDGNSLDALVGRADRALYRAKQEGRNRVVCFQADAPNAPAVIAA
jgi:diguanylate cyclase (GGDEF)-like protein